MILDDIGWYLIWDWLVLIHLLFDHRKATSFFDARRNGVKISHGLLGFRDAGDYTSACIPKRHWPCTVGRSSRVVETEMRRKSMALRVGRILWDDADQHDSKQTGKNMYIITIAIAVGLISYIYIYVYIYIELYRYKCNIVCMYVL